MSNNLNRNHRRRAAALGMTVDEYSEALDEQDEEGTLPPSRPPVPSPLDDDVLIDIKELCAELGGTKPVSKPTAYRAILHGIIDPPVHPTPGISRWYRNHTRRQIRAYIAAKGNGAK